MSTILNLHKYGNMDNMDNGIIGKWVIMGEQMGDNGRINAVAS